MLVSILHPKCLPAGWRHKFCFIAAFPATIRGCKSHVEHPARCRSGAAITMLCCCKAVFGAVLWVAICLLLVAVVLRFGIDANHCWAGTVSETLQQPCISCATRRQPASGLCALACQCLVQNLLVECFVDPMLCWEWNECWMQGHSDSDGVTDNR